MVSFRYSFKPTSGGPGSAGAARCAWLPRFACSSRRFTHTPRTAVPAAASSATLARRSLRRAAVTAVTAGAFLSATSGAAAAKQLILHGP
jgi:hypothetical protein